jgi:hypothetical protein
VAYRRRLVQDRTRISHRLTAQLKAYFPHVFWWFDAIRPLLVGALRRRWPTVEAIKKVRPSTRETCFHAPNSVRQETISTRMAALKEAVPLTTETAVMNSSVRMIKALAAPLETPMEAIREFDQAMEQLWSTHADDHLCASLPGAGTVYAARRNMSDRRGP